MLQPRKASNVDLAVADAQIPNAYVLPVEESKPPIKETTPQQPPTPQTIPTGPIKSVCELSTTVTAPTLNLTTRHTDVKSPFDRGFSST